MRFILGSPLWFWRSIHRKPSLEGLSGLLGLPVRASLPIRSAMTASICLPQSGAAITEQRTLAMKSRYISFALSALCLFLVGACNQPAEFTGFLKKDLTGRFRI